jgi:hypothetical protein
MKKFWGLIFLFFIAGHLYAQNEIGPEGKKIAWLLAALIPVALYFLLIWFRRWKNGKKKE